MSWCDTRRNDPTRETTSTHQVQKVLWCDARFRLARKHFPNKTSKTFRHFLFCWIPARCWNYQKTNKRGVFLSLDALFNFIVLNKYLLNDCSLWLCIVIPARAKQINHRRIPNVGKLHLKGWSFAFTRLSVPHRKLNGGLNQPEAALEENSLRQKSSSCPIEPDLLSAEGIELKHRNKDRDEWRSALEIR